MEPSMVRAEQETINAKRFNIVKEVLSTEEDYAICLEIMVDGYKRPLLALAETEELPTRSKLEIRQVFSNVEQIQGLNKQVLECIRSRVDTWSDLSLIGDIFLKVGPFFKMYNEYGNNYEAAGDVLARCEQDPNFNGVVHRLEKEAKEKWKVHAQKDGAFSLKSLLITPIQRIPRCEMLLRVLERRTGPQHPDFRNISSALATFHNVMNYLDRNIIVAENMKKFLSMAKNWKGANRLIHPHRALITEGVAHIKKKKDVSDAGTTVKKGFKGLKSLTKMATGENALDDRIQIWLFNDVLVHLRLNKNKSRTDVADTEYTWPLELVWLQDVPGEDPEDPKMPWSFVLIGPCKTYILRFQTHTEKIAWKVSIEKAVANVLNEQIAPDDVHRYGSTIVIEIPRQQFLVLTIGNTPMALIGAGVGHYRFPSKAGGQKKGGEYEGWWKFGRIHGKGSFKFFGNTYSGEWKYNKKCGIGSFELVTGESYHGEFNEDLPNGHGTFQYTNGDIYEGEWKDGLRNGMGALRYENGNKYHGEWQLNMPSGEGTYTTAFGLVYKGGWFCGRMHGYGILIHPNGRRYEGDFREGCKEGSGKMDYGNGDFYVGQWHNDTRHGFGVFHSAVVGVYEGLWQCDIKEGPGKLVFSSGNVYDGLWKRNCFHGKGILHCVNGAVERYDGEWEVGKHQGKGSLFYRNGSRYEGQFKDGNPHGQGIFVSRNSVEYDGKWTEGRREGKATISVGPQRFTSNCVGGMLAERECRFMVVPDLPVFRLDL